MGSRQVLCIVVFVDIEFLWTIETLESFESIRGKPGSSSDKLKKSRPEPHIKLLQNLK